MTSEKNVIRNYAPKTHEIFIHIHTDIGDLMNIGTLKIEVFMVTW